MNENGQLEACDIPIGNGGSVFMEQSVMEMASVDSEEISFADSCSAANALLRSITIQMALSFKKKKKKQWNCLDDPSFALSDFHPQPQRPMLSGLVDVVRRA